MAVQIYLRRFPEFIFARTSRVPVPPADEQLRILKRLDRLDALLNSRLPIINEMNDTSNALLKSAFNDIVQGAPTFPLSSVAHLVRRAVDIDPEEMYTEIGIRSFYGGIFHRRSIKGSEFSWQKLFMIRKGDLVFSNIMAWEQAIAEAFDQDDGCVGNHRMLTCQPVSGVMVPGFLSYFFRTQAGFAEITKASPGTAARNKTLSTSMLEAIQVPTPSYEKQLWFDRLQQKVRELSAIRAQAEKDANAIIPSMLHEIFGHEGK